MFIQNFTILEHTWKLILYFNLANQGTCETPEPKAVRSLINNKHGLTCHLSVLTLYQIMIGKKNQIILHTNNYSVPDNLFINNKPFSFHRKYTPSDLNHLIALGTISSEEKQLVNKALQDSLNFSHYDQLCTWYFGIK